MPRLEIHPLSEEFRAGCAALLEDRHRRHRRAEPLLPEITDFSAQIPEESGAVATRGDKVVGYVIAMVSDTHAEGGYAGCAASEPEVLRDIYAHLAQDWPPRHQLVIPASDQALIDPWFRLAFGCQWMAAVRETTPEEPVDFGGRIRPSTPDDLKAVAGFDRLLWTHAARSPSFSGRNPEAEDFEAEWANLWSESEYPLHVVAELDGEVVGHALMYDRPTGDLRVPEQNVDLGHAATLESVRGRGVALALTAHVIRWAYDSGYRSITTDWRSPNLEASRFWPNRGFRPQYLRLYRAIP